MGIFDRNAEPDPKRERLEHLCGLIDITFKQFRKAGEALREIRDEQLYRITHKTFSDFCRDRWGITDRHATRLINAANVCDLLGEAGYLIESEHQARQVAKIESDQLVEFSADITSHGSVNDAIRRHLPKGKTSKKKLKPIRFRLPGCTLIIEPNKKYPGLEATIGNLLKALEQKNAA